MIDGRDDWTESAATSVGRNADQPVIGASLRSLRQTILSQTLAAERLNEISRRCLTGAIDGALQHAATILTDAPCTLVW